MPARSTALMCTNTSREPSLGVMKPKPFWVLKNFTVPVAIVAISFGELRFRLLAPKANCRLGDRNIRIFEGCLDQRLKGQRQQGRSKKTSFQQGLAYLEL